MQIRLFAIALAVFTAPSAATVYQGFNYGSLKDDGSCQGYDGFKQLFNRAKNLPGVSDFTAARLKTSYYRCGTSVVPIEAFRAAIDTNTKILLNALINAVMMLSSTFTDRVIGISVVSEDSKWSDSMCRVFRSSLAGIANKAGPGATAGEIQMYINWAREWLKATPLETKPITHVDSCKSGLSATVDVAQGQKIWITKTGWPATGPTLRDAVPSVENARTSCNTVGCALFRKRNTFWYTLVDAAMTDEDLSFGITPVAETTPRFDLTCP
ncbi:GPI-anchored cell wall beta-1,3-endoglucanase EglC [Xylaria curta]|nr:GPI-anchored cell wall beta-1,3-endoglucanase EglC [Xylaria curta]